MGLFDKLRRIIDVEPSDRPDEEIVEEAPPAAIIDLRRDSQPPERGLEPDRPVVRRAVTHYDPTQPGQTPVSGVDLITFAVLSRRLQQRPTQAHANLLAGYGHTPESWSAVSTVWMARMGQLPFLYDVYEHAYHSG
jgi:hypothetical protein